MLPQIKPPVQILRLANIVYSFVGPTRYHFQPAQGDSNPANDAPFGNDPGLVGTDRCPFSGRRSRPIRRSQVSKIGPTSIGGISNRTKCFILLASKVPAATAVEVRYWLIFATIARKFYTFNDIIFDLA